MAPVLARALRGLGFGLLAALAATGVALSALVAVASTNTMAGLLTRSLEGAIAGKVTAELLQLRSDGGIEVGGLRIEDPHGHLVISARRLGIRLGLTRLAGRSLGLAVEVEDPAVRIDTEPDGSLSIARAFAPPARAGANAEAAGGGGGGWRIRLDRLALRGGDLRYTGADRGVLAHVEGIAIDAHGAWEGGEATLVLRLDARATAPVQDPLSLELSARLGGGRLEVGALTGSLGATEVQGLGEVELEAGAFRAAASRLALGAAEARRAFPSVPLAADLQAGAYAGSDGVTITAAVVVPPGGAPAPGGALRAAVALRPGGARPALGFEAALDAFDPSRVVARAPPARLTLAARGAVAGRSLSALDGRVTLELAPSTVRGVSLGPISLAARASGGLVEVTALEARLPGLSVSGSGRWSPRGELGGELAVTADDLARLGAGVATIVGRPLPPIAGRLTARVTASGTGALPALEARLEAPALSAGGARIEALSMAFEAAGPTASARGRLEGRAARLRVGGVEARDLVLGGSLTEGEATLALTASVPELGPDPVTIGGAATLDRAAGRARIRELSLRWPAVQLELERPATLTFDPPRVDRLALASGPRSVALSGGLGAGGTLDVLLEASRLDLAWLPRALVPPALGVGGELSLEARATGQAGAPEVAVHLELADGAVGSVTGLALAGDATWDGVGRLTASLAAEAVSVRDLGGLGATLAVAGGREGVRIESTAALSGAPLFRVDARIAADPAALLRDLASAGHALGRATLAGVVEVPGVELRSLAGRVGLPAELEGTLSGRAELSGTLAAPRGVAAARVTGVAALGYRDVGAELELRAEPERTALTVQATLGRAEALRAGGGVRVAVERLLDRAARRSATLAFLAEVPTLTLGGGEGPPVPLGGTISAKLVLAGTLASPEARLDAAGTGLEVAGHPLGELTALVRHEATRTRAELSLRPAGGGTLDAAGSLVAPGGLAEPGALATAEAEVRVRGAGLELGFLPALLPGPVRHASGGLEVDLSARGPLARLRPRGTVRVEGARIALAGLGEWHGVEVAASLGDDAVEVSRLEARQGAGRLSGTLSVNGLESQVVRVEGRLALRELTLTRASSEVVTLDLPIALEGSVAGRRLDATVTLEAGTIRLPRKAPRALQAVEGRPDVVELDLVEASRRERARRGEPFVAQVRVLAPGGLLVKGDKPPVNLELEADTTVGIREGTLGLEGTVEVVRGTVEPFAGRLFHLERGKVTFPGGAPKAGLLDVVARYDNPKAIVTVTIGDTIEKPSIQLTSEPALGDAAISMLIATGDTEVNLNTKGVGTMNAQQTGEAVASAAMTAAFSGLVADKLPVDQVSVDSTRVRAGKYVTDELFIGYAYRFEAKQEEGENVNEVRAEYRIGRRWHVELRYGDAQAGDASLIWRKDY